MARDTIDRQLTDRCRRVQFAVATAVDDTGIRRLLRDNAMEGQISISLEREPNYFADSNLPGETKQTIIAREGGRIVCTGSCTVRRRFINGTPLRVGYLGSLRLDAKYAGRFDILRRGYEFFRELQPDFHADLYFTSIASDNVRARWFLERGLSGMPIYEHIGDFVTLLVPTTARHLNGENKGRTPDSWQEVVAALNRSNLSHQFAPYWSEGDLEALRPLGLKLDDFFQISWGFETVCAAIWDQRLFKQTVIRNYAPPLKQVRPWLNFASGLNGGIRLPAINETLANAFILNLTASENPEAVVQLLKTLSATAAGKGIELLTLGFGANDPRLSWVRQCFRGREYPSRLYSVTWADRSGTVKKLAPHILAPEVAFL